jgi:hypothetical protein
MFILKILRVTDDGVVPIALKPGLPATFFRCSYSKLQNARSFNCYQKIGPEIPF